MKGIVFTEFVEMVEARHGMSAVDTIIARSRLPSGGAYTAVGTYDHAELLELVTALSALSGTPVPEVVRDFGRHLLRRFVQGFPQFFQDVASPVEFLCRVDGCIHAEVLKLYPDAELPRFVARPEGPDRMELDYLSSRPFADLAQGLIEGTAEHFGCRLRLEREVVPEVGVVRFRLAFERSPVHA